MGRNRSNATAPAVKGNLVAGTGADTSGLLTVGANGTVLTADSAEATGLKWATPATPPSGKVLQVVSSTFTTTTTITSASMTDTGIELSITPTSATSKILVFINAQMRHNRTAFFSQIGGQIVRNGSAILTWNIPDLNVVETGNGTDVRVGDIISTQYLDAPATTSSVTYKFQSAVSTGASASVVYQRGNGPSVMTLMEIGA
jgi:hypothetical protein